MPESSATHRMIALRDLGFAGPLVRHKSSQRQYFLSLMHWFEAEKFRLGHPEIAEDCMNSHSFRMLAKLSKRNQDKWRDDWGMVRGRVMLCGMTYAMWADPDPTRWSSPELAAQLAEMGFPVRFAEMAYSEFQKLWPKPQVIFFGADQAPPEVIGRRLNLIHKKYEKYWSGAFWLGRHANWRIYDWMREQHIPVMPLGEPGDRLTMDTSLAISDGRHSVVFDQKATKVMDPLIKQLKSLKRDVDVDPYAVTGAGTSLGLALD